MIIIRNKIEEASGKETMAYVFNGVHFSKEKHCISATNGKHIVKISFDKDEFGEAYKCESDILVPLYIIKTMRGNSPKRIIEIHEITESIKDDTVMIKYSGKDGISVLGYQKVEFRYPDFDKYLQEIKKGEKVYISLKPEQLLKIMKASGCFDKTLTFGIDVDDPRKGFILKYRTVEDDVECAFMPIKARSEKELNIMNKDMVQINIVAQEATV